MTHSVPRQQLRTGANSHVAKCKMGSSPAPGMCSRRRSSRLAIGSFNKSNQSRKLHLETTQKRMIWLSDKGITLVLPLTAAGAPRHAAGRTAGVALQQARQAKERTHPEFSRAAHAGLVILALEVGGRWSFEAASFIRLLEGPCQERPRPITRRQHFRVHATMVCALVICRGALFRRQPPVAPC